jgi:small subunit ribosomal protein S4
MRNIRRKYQRPKAHWDSARIAEERAILREYGLRVKRELWNAQEILRSFRQRARDLIAVENKHEEKALLDKLVKLGILKKENTLDDVLALTVNDILDRRLQTMVFRKGIAKTPLQARQFIVHGHVLVDDKKTTFPSYLIPAEDESKIRISGGK